MKCHKYEINLRKRIHHEIEVLRKEIARDNDYLRNTYTTDEQEYICKRIEKSELILQTLERLVDTAKSNIR